METINTIILSMISGNISDLEADSCIHKLNDIAYDLYFDINAELLDIIELQFPLSYKRLLLMKYVRYLWNFVVILSSEHTKISEEVNMITKNKQDYTHEKHIECIVTCLRNDKNVLKSFNKFIMHGITLSDEISKLEKSALDEYKNEFFIRSDQLKKIFDESTIKAIGISAEKLLQCDFDMSVDKLAFIYKNNVNVLSDAVMQMIINCKILLCTIKALH